MTLKQALSLLALPTFLLGHGLADSKTTLIEQALDKSGKNRAQIAEALEWAPDQQQSALRSLISSMPKHDLEKLSANYLLKNVDPAFKARASMPWGKDIPESLFLNDVLP